MNAKQVWLRVILLFMAALLVAEAGVIVRVVQAQDAPAAHPRSLASMGMPVKAARLVEQPSLLPGLGEIEVSEELTPSLAPLPEELHLPSVLAATIPVTGETAVEPPQEIPQRPPPEQWKEWPVLPVLTPELRELYLQGLANGNNAHAFSFLGDCQSQPSVFMGAYDYETHNYRRSLPDHLLETAEWFAGQFDRYNPAVKDGTTSGALLWMGWNENRMGQCDKFESPLDCELRVNRPSIVVIHIGTHWEDRNRKYLTTVIETVLAHQAIPILSTKADNREGDERLNYEMAVLADEFDLPFWNFWAAVQDLDNHGMRRGSEMYLSNEGLAVHRYSALEMLDTVRRQAQVDAEEAGN